MKLRLVLFFTLIAIATHFYLAGHYYELALGLSSGDAFCNINEAFNCDAASASSFAQVLGIPIAAFGAAANLILLFLVFGWMIRWSDRPKVHGGFTFLLASAIALASLVMGSISALVLGQFCLYCMVTYLTSFINFELIRRSFKEVDDDPEVKSLSDALGFLVKPAFLKVYAAFLLAIPASAVMLDRALLNQYGADNIQKAVEFSISDWQSANSLTFDIEPSFSVGPDDAKFVIKEFADFRCVHCKSASPSISAFISAHKDVQLKFYNFPLDGACNDGIPRNGISCLLAASVQCAELNHQKGYEFHHLVFENQDKFARASLSDTKNLLSELANQLNMDKETLLSCTESEEVQQAIKDQASLGKRVNVQGTPSFFVNDRRLQRAQSLPVLRKAYELSK